MDALTAGGFMVSNAIKKIGLAILVCVLAFVGGLVGLVVGSLAGLTKGAGFEAGARTGAFCGALVSVQLLLGPTPVSGGPSSLVHIFLSISSGTFLDDWAGLTTYDQEEADMIEANFEAHWNIFCINTTTGMLPESIKKLPNFVVDNQGNMKSSIKGITCVICFQDLDQGDAARSLPQCGHLFHMICVDKWLLVHASCPVCRQNVRHK
ncbi:NEP1-interacting protein 2-like [Nymphaea colorata]|nr:NEP1-interacting protein 2-like [Nymphaea colorata]